MPGRIEEPALRIELRNATHHRAVDIAQERLPLRKRREPAEMADWELVMAQPVEADRDIHYLTTEEQQAEVTRDVGGEREAGRQRIGLTPLQRQSLRRVID